MPPRRAAVRRRGLLVRRGEPGRRERHRLLRNGRVRQRGAPRAPPMPARPTPGPPSPHTLAPRMLRSPALRPLIAAYVPSPRCFSRQNPFHPPLSPLTPTHHSPLTGLSGSAAAPHHRHNHYACVRAPLSLPPRRVPAATRSAEEPSSSAAEESPSWPRAASPTSSPRPRDLRPEAARSTSRPASCTSPTRRSQTTSPRARR